MNGVSRLTVLEDIVLITIRNPTGDHVLIGDIFSEFSKHGIVIDMISQTVPQGSTMDISFTTYSAHMIPALEVISRIKDRYQTLKIMVSTGNCKLHLYGEEMREMNGVAATALGVLLRNEIDIAMITTSEVDISMVIPASFCQNSVELLQQAFSVTASDTIEGVG